MTMQFPFSRMPDLMMLLPQRGESAVMVKLSSTMLVFTGSSSVGARLVSSIFWKAATSVSEPARMMRSPG